jgi:hypothetical protein
MSTDAYIRQRLAIHSLLRQSDFVDDSREAAPEPLQEPALSWTASTEDGQVQEPEAEWVSPRDQMFPVIDATTDPCSLFGPQYGGAVPDFSAWACNPNPQDLSGYLAFDEQYMY